MHFLLEKKVLNNSGFFIKNHGGQRKVAKHFSNAERTNHQPRILHPEKYPSEIKENQDIRLILVSMAIGSSLNRKEMIK